MRLKNLNLHLKLHIRSDSNYFATDTKRFEAVRSVLDLVCWLCTFLLPCFVPVSSFPPSRQGLISDQKRRKLFARVARAVREKAASSKVANVSGKNWTFLCCFDFFLLRVSCCLSSRTEQKPEFSREDHGDTSTCPTLDAQTYNHGESA